MQTAEMISKQSTSSSEQLLYGDCRVSRLHFWLYTTANCPPSGVMRYQWMSTLICFVHNICIYIARQQHLSLAYYCACVGEWSCLHSLTSRHLITCNFTALLTLYNCNYNASSLTQTLKSNCSGKHDYFTTNSHCSSDISRSSVSYIIFVFTSPDCLMSSQYSVFIAWTGCCHYCYYLSTQLPLGYFCTILST